MESDFLERTYRVNRHGDIWFFDKNHKAVKVIAGRNLPDKIAWLFYDILVNEGQ